MVDSISELGPMAQPCRTSFQAPPVLQTALSEVASELTFGSGQRLFTANAPATGIYLVRSGAVRAYLTSGEGHEVVNRVLGPGALLGVPAAMCAKSYQFTGGDARGLRRNLDIQRVLADASRSLHASRHNDE